ncbi:hypothetical protein AYX22_17910 [Arthrobacter sp. D5-1]|nr:hypothetical protein AYX22_17910 [Arthrobacter sp. D5-1]
MNIPHGRTFTTNREEPSTFLRMLTEHGVDARPRGLTPAKKKEILRLRKQGMVIREIAKRVGCSYDTARLFLLASVSD